MRMMMNMRKSRTKLPAPIRTATAVRLTKGSGLGRRLGKKFASLAIAIREVDMGDSHVDATLESDRVFLSQVLLRAISRQCNINETLNLDERARLGFASDDVREYEFHAHTKSDFPRFVKLFLQESFRSRA